MTSPMDEALALPGAVLTEAKRVFGEDAQVVYGNGFARAAIDLNRDSDEIAIFHAEPLPRLLACLKALPSIGGPP